MRTSVRLLSAIEAANAVLKAAPFMRQLGATVTAIGKGTADTALAVQPWQKQHHGFLHAGVSMTLADHTAGMCATTVLDSSTHAVLTSSTAFNLLAPGRGDRIECHARIVKAGKTLTVVDSGVACLLMPHSDWCGLLSLRLTALASHCTLVWLCLALLSDSGCYWAVQSGADECFAMS
eukprot:m.102290 g.102290  ORF g.102290 m.102290 type:complete len:178 (-) comp8820_c0_seq2:244-777(-)